MRLTPQGVILPDGITKASGVLRVSKAPKQIAYLFLGITVIKQSKRLMLQTSRVKIVLPCDCYKLLIAQDSHGDILRNACADCKPDNDAAQYWTNTEPLAIMLTSANHRSIVCEAFPSR